MGGREIEWNRKGEGRGQGRERMDREEREGEREGEQAPWIAVAVASFGPSSVVGVHTSSGGLYTHIPGVHKVQTLFP